VPECAAIVALIRLPRRSPFPCANRENRHERCRFRAEARSHATERRSQRLDERRLEVKTGSSRWRRPVLAMAKRFLVMRKPLSKTDGRRSGRDERCLAMRTCPSSVDGRSFERDARSLTMRSGLSRADGRLSALDVAFIPTREGSLTSDGQPSARDGPLIPLRNASLDSDSRREVLSWCWLRNNSKL